MSKEENSNPISEYFEGCFRGGYFVVYEEIELVTRELGTVHYHNCSTCGATISYDGLLKHSQWHKSIDDIVQQLIGINPSEDK